MNWSKLGRRSEILRAAARAVAAAALMIPATCAFRCDLLESDWHLDAIDDIATPADAKLQCDVAIPTDTHAGARDSCAFHEGTSAEQSLGIDPATAATFPIRHLVIAMKENRSFDHLLGRLHDDGQPAAEALPPSFTNLDENHRAVPFHDARTTCIQEDPDHQSDAIQQGIDSGRMDGFVLAAESSTSTDGHFAMSVYNRRDLPFYYWLADTYALSDRHFAPMATGTYANRNFLLFGTSAGVVDTYLSYAEPTTPSIFRALMENGYTWGAYTDGQPMSGALAWDNHDPGVHSMAEFYAAADAGKLPSVSFVDGIDDVEDDHPTADVQVGEAWLRRLYEHVAGGPEWSRTAIVWTYDEGGGFADHVPPPKGCAAENAASDPTQRGPRVPLVVISPWAKRHYVSHVVHDHTAILRLAEVLFGLPALTRRDANSDALLDLFDFSCANGAAPIPEAPPSGVGRCRVQD